MKSKLLILGFFVLGLGFLACGGGTNNDQGASFQALGFFASADETNGDNGTVVPLNDDTGTELFPLFIPIDKDPSTPELDGGYIGLQNNLTTQFIRTVRSECSYVVPGATVSIPSDSFAFTATLQKAPSAGGSSSSSSSGTSGSTTSNKTFAQIEIVSPDVLQFLNNNINSLPALPFRMTAICTVIGVTQAGDVMETNPVYYTIQFVEHGTGTDTVNGDGTGGDLDSFDGITDGTSSSSSSSSSSGA